MSHERTEEELGDVNGLTKEKVDKLVKVYIKDAKEGLLETKGWPMNFLAYMVPKVVFKAYTRVLAKAYLNININAVYPVYVKIELNNNTGILIVEEGTESPVMVALMPHGGPPGLFFSRTEVSTF
ncbi:unnamed protein product [Ilex paraguariensis]|uniref:Uncharacterized protein n=1 Tax=Ilex paraguariensis TaxID=185542 RepID=A0ABC8SUC2_9AQUA